MKKIQDDLLANKVFTFPETFQMNSYTLGRRYAIVLLLCFRSNCLLSWSASNWRWTNSEGGPAPLIPGEVHQNFLTIYLFIYLFNPKSYGDVVVPFIDSEDPYLSVWSRDLKSVSP